VGERERDLIYIKRREGTSDESSPKIGRTGTLPHARGTIMEEEETFLDTIPLGGKESLLKDD